mmetsp:Transcript_23818/g.23576  ORF Transcript_23818/g.23576 Transcript_23818/m.23576 type:complete len:81 (+) Transcript_23818:59-301(+)
MSALWRQQQQEHSMLTMGRHQMLPFKWGPWTAAAEHTKRDKLSIVGNRIVDRSIVTTTTIAKRKGEQQQRQETIEHQNLL